MVSGEIMTVGVIIKHNVPMIVTFNEQEVEEIAYSLAAVIEMSFNVVSMFSFPDEMED
jgi:hypothetical protein